MKNRSTGSCTRFNIGIILSFVLLSGFSLDTLGQKREEWRNPEVFAINKEQAHAEFVIYKSRAEANKPINLKNPWDRDSYLSLNGQWDFNWYGSLKDVPADWYSPNSKVNIWNTIHVPGTWQKYGFDRLYYLGKFMPYEYNWATGKRLEAFNKENIEQAKATGYIPDNAQTVGCYRKWLDLNTAQLAEKVTLRIGAVEAGVEVYVNGKSVAYSQGSLTPAEFDISAYLKEGKNLIALKVYRWTDGSYMEDQDMVRFAGIYRDVFLRFDPKQHIRDIKFIGTPEKNLKKINTTYAVDIVNKDTKSLKGAKLAFELLPHGSSKAVETWSREVDKLSGNGNINISGELTFEDLKLWSPDLPNLYTLVVTLKDKKQNTIQVARLDAGFKLFENINGNLHLNGKRFYIRGVNRHDHHPTEGRHVPLANLIRDIELMKKNNINTVRTSHYPNDERWYYLCNRYGIALIDEANVESHGFEDVPGNRPQWTAAAVDRVESMIERDKNHPSILIWSLGNEQGWGWTTAFEAQYNRAKEIDPSRMVMCDRGGREFKKTDIYNNPLRLDKPDFVTPMYRVYDETAVYLKNRDKDKRPFFMCEYRHAMGNSVGSLDEIWDHFYINEENGLNGGCIWDWTDQGVEAKTEDGRIYYQYGGDWGDKFSVKNFSMNGLLLSDQGVTPKLAEVKKCYEPFTMEQVSLKNQLYTVKNRLNQVSLEKFQVKWDLLENGVSIQSGILDKVQTAPGEEQTFKVPYDAAVLKDTKEYFLRISYALKKDTKWASKGHEITFSEFKVKGAYHYTVDKSDKAPTIKQENGIITIEAGDKVSLQFLEINGFLNSLKVNNTELLTDSKREFWFDNSIAWIDNLTSLNNKGRMLATSKKYDIENLKQKGDAEIRITKQNMKVILTIKHTLLSVKNFGFEEVQTWTVNGNGHIEVVESVNPIGAFKNDDWVARIGLRIPLRSNLENVSYYGLGPHGNYPDRKYGAWMGIHTSKVADSYVPYGRPQDHGNRESVRWLKVIDDSGNGLKVIAPEPLSMSVLPYSQDQLNEALHTIDLPQKSTISELRIAVKVCGLGNGSCGPKTTEEYQVKLEPLKYRFLLIPQGGGHR